MFSQTRLIQMLQLTTKDWVMFTERNPVDNTMRLHRVVGLEAQQPCSPHGGLNFTKFTNLETLM
jgi:hypothetical protein